MAQVYPSQGWVAIFLGRKPEARSQTDAGSHSWLMATGSAPGFLPSIHVFGKHFQSVFPLDGPQFVRIKSALRQTDEVLCLTGAERVVASEKHLWYSGHGLEPLQLNRIRGLGAIIEETSQMKEPGVWLCRPCQNIRDRVRRADSESLDQRKARFRHRGRR